MKIRLKILLIVIVILAITYTAFYTFILFQGKSVIAKQLGNLTQKKVSIGYLELKPLFNLKIEKLDIPGILKADVLYVSPSILGLLTGNIVLNQLRLVRPEFTYTRLPPKVMEEPLSPAETQGFSRKHSRHFVVKYINIQEGRINFIDRSVGPEAIRIIIKDIKFKLSNLYLFPATAVTNFELKAAVHWRENHTEGRMEAEGWLDIFKKNMQATLKVTDIDGIYLYPYYSKWVDLEKARIEKASLNFTSNIHSLNNNLTAECHLELADIVRKPLEPEEYEEKASKITGAILDIFRALNQGKIVLDFIIRTRMDRPELGFGSVKSAFEEKIALSRKAGSLKPKDILLLPGNLVQGTAKGATDISRALLEGTMALGKEIKDALEAAFKKVKKEE